MKFTNIEEVVARWSPDQHVFVQGELGLGQKQLSDLRTWLKENAPHWTVVLMQQASDQSFKAQDGRSYTGLDAVEYALGNGLNNRTEFGRLEHPKTLETDGAAFVLFLKERKFSYYASDAQNRRKLGQSHWVGELDQPAFRAMQSGGRILDAVKNTIESINAKLNQAIESEQNAERRVAQERDRAVASVTALIAQLRTSVSNVEARAAEFRLLYPSASDTMAHPPIAQWQQSTTAAENALNADTARAIEQQLSETSRSISRYLNAYASQAGMEQQVSGWTNQAERLERSPSESARTRAGEARALIDQAETAIAAGQLEFTELLPKIDAKLVSGNAEVLAQGRRIQVQQMQDASVRYTLLVGLGALGLLMLPILAVANRWRRSAMSKAKNQLAQREAQTQSEVERIDRLFTRNHDLLGSLEKIDQRGYVGSTRELALRAFHYVDDLFILSKEVQRVLREARRSIYPNNPMARLLNLLSSRHYQQGLDHITGTPLKFSRVTGIPLIVSSMRRDADAAVSGGQEFLQPALRAGDETRFAGGAGEDTKTDRNSNVGTNANGSTNANANANANAKANTSTSTSMSTSMSMSLGTSTGRSLNASGNTNGSGEELDSDEQISLTFEEVFAVLQQRGAEATAALATLEDCLITVQDRLTQLQQELQAASAQEEELQKHFQQDGALSVPAYFDALIPAVQAQLQRAEEQATFDAVGAVQGPIATAARQLTEAQSLGQDLLAARRDLLPALRASASALESLHIPTQWISDELGTIAMRSNELMQSVASNAMSVEIAASSKALTALREHAEQAVDLAQRIHTEMMPAVDQSAQNIDRTRQDIALSLGAAIEHVLHEKSFDPDDHVAACRAALATAQTMLGQGRNQAVEEAIRTVATELQQVDQILAASLQSVSTFESLHHELEQTVRQQVSRVAPILETLQQAKRDFAATALLVGKDVAYRSSTTPTRAATQSGQQPNNGQGSKDQAQSVGSLLDEAQRSLDQVQQRLIEAHQQQHRGEVLRAADGLARCKAELLDCENRLQQVAAHLELLASQTRENRTLQENNEHMLATLQQSDQNPLITRGTLESIQRSVASVTEDRKRIDAPTASPNPFEIARSLSQTQQRLEQLRLQTIADERAHSDARRAVANASQQLTIAGQLVRQSQTDGVPDSPEITRANSRFESLARDLHQVECELNILHGDWSDVTQAAARVQSDLTVVTKTLGSELQTASQALVAFQQATQAIQQATQWTGSRGVRIVGSPGIQELEQARHSLQTGNYATVLQISRVAMLAAQMAIQQAEREVIRKRMEEERVAEAARRARMLAEAIMHPRSGSFGSGGFGSGGFGSGGFGSGGFGSGGFGSGGFGSGGFGSHRQAGNSDSHGGGGGSSSARSSGGGQSGANESGFKRSGW